MMTIFLINLPLPSSNIIRECMILEEKHMNAKKISLRNTEHWDFAGGPVVGTPPPLQEAWL